MQASRVLVLCLPDADAIADQDVHNACITSMRALSLKMCTTLHHALLAGRFQTSDDDEGAKVLDLIRGCLASTDVGFKPDAC